MQNQLNGLKSPVPTGESITRSSTQDYNRNYNDVTISYTFDLSNIGTYKIYQLIFKQTGIIIVNDDGPRKLRAIISIKPSGTYLIEGLSTNLSINYVSTSDGARITSTTTYSVDFPPYFNAYYKTSVNNSYVLFDATSLASFKSSDDTIHSEATTYSCTLRYNIYRIS